MCSVEKVGKKETNKLEGHRYHAVPYEGEDGPDGEAFDVDFVVTAETGADYRRFPVRRCGVCGCLFVGLKYVSIVRD